MRGERWSGPLTLGCVQVGASTSTVAYPRPLLCTERGLRPSRRDATSGREASRPSATASYVPHHWQAKAKGGTTVTGRRHSKQSRRLLWSNPSARYNTPELAIDCQSHQHARWPAPTFRQSSRSYRYPCLTRIYLKATPATTRRCRVV